MCARPAVAHHSGPLRVALAFCVREHTAKSCVSWHCACDWPTSPEQLKSQPCSCPIARADATPETHRRQSSVPFPCSHCASPYGRPDTAVCSCLSQGLGITAPSARCLSDLPLFVHLHDPFDPYDASACLYPYLARLTTTAAPAAAANTSAARVQKRPPPFRLSVCTRKLRQWDTHALR